jgi:L-alanine-DL-glutamate epimerase-like enolase superfamily enzyme
VKGASAFALGEVALSRGAKLRAPATMKITRLATAVVEANFHWTYVRVYADDAAGLHGTGECFFAPGLTAMLQDFGPVLVGENPLDVERLVEKMRWAASGAGSLGGIVWNAISGIEAALWDLKGKRLGLPVWQLLGGRFREEVRLYLDCHAEGALGALSPLLQPARPPWTGPKAPPLPPEAVLLAAAERAKAMAGLGYTALKFDLDPAGTSFDSASGYTLRSRDVDWMIALGQALRAAVGPGVDLAMDAHWRYRPHEVLPVARGLESCRLLWLEDPVPPQDHRGLAYLRAHTTTPLGTGENLQLREGFWPLLAADLCDVLTPDVQKCGGLAEAKKIADLAHAANKPVAPHMIGSPLALLAAAHVAVAIPNLLVCELHAHDVPFFHELVRGGTAEWFRPGFVQPLDRPGLGMELDETVGRRYRLPGTAWFDER